MSADQGHGGERCREIFARLSEYLDQELDAGLCDRLERHFNGCEPCRAFLESLRRTVRAVGDAGASSALPDDLRRQLFEAYARLEGEADG